MNTTQIKKEPHQVNTLATNYENAADYTLPGPPMDVESYTTRIRNAQDRVKAGNFTTLEDLKKEMKQW